MSSDPSKSKAGRYIGVDLGGTKILAGLFDSQFHLIHKVKRRTKAFLGPSEVLNRIARTVREVLEKSHDPSQVLGVGVGAPGSVDPVSGRILFAPNLAWKDFPLKKLLEEKIGLPVAVGNDCNNCALGIYEVEFKAKAENFIGVFIGTGIGCGIILNRQIHLGFNRTAGELGHMVLLADGPKCRCGNHGCFEALASRTAIYRRIQEAVECGEQTCLTQMLGPKLADLRSNDLKKALAQNDALVQRIVRNAARYAGIATANLINLLNPDAIVIGGGVIEALGKEMMPIIAETAQSTAMSGTAKGIRIHTTELGDHAGIVGGAVLARNTLNLEPSGQAK